MLLTLIKPLSEAVISIRLISPLSCGVGAIREAFLIVCSVFAIGSSHPVTAFALPPVTHAANPQAH